MKNLGLVFAGRTLLAALAALPIFCQAAPPTDPGPRKIPDALLPWQSWALWGDEDRRCPTPYNDANKHLCFWPSRMGLQVSGNGAVFDLTVTVFHDSWLPLPGTWEAWPLEVKANGVLLPVLEHGGGPAVRLTTGTFHVEGAFRWNAIPQSVPVPSAIGMLALVVDGQPVDAPAWDEGGILWLKRNASTEETDKNFLSVKVYAALEDGIPQWLRTQIELTVAGKSREEDLGTIIPEGWKLSAVDSPIPALVDDTGRMKAQVRAGKWVLHADAFRFDNPKEFRYGPNARPAAAEELVAFRAQPDFRTVEITGAPSIDVSQTTFPTEWRDLPVYRWDTTTAFQFAERMRGMGEQKPAGLTIARELWLDENGGGYTFRDRLTGPMQRTWRLDAAEGQGLGSVRSGGQGQLITRNPQNGAPGVEIRTRNLNLEATGRMARTGDFPATGWRSDADGLTTILHLPPGWRLFALFGADWVRGDWLTSWTLLDLFLLLLFSLAVFRLWGLRAGLLAFAGFGLSYHEAGAPRYLWLILLVPLALQRVAPEGWGRRLVGIGKWLVILAFVLVFVPFLAGQVQQALYPQLENAVLFQGVSFSPNGTALEESRSAPAAPAIETATPSASTEAIRRKLERIIIPKIELKEATIRDAIDFLKKKSVEMDDNSPPGEKGINIILKLDASDSTPPPELAKIPGIPGLAPEPGAAALPPPAIVNPNDARITVSLTNIPLIEALKYVTGLANLNFKVEPYAVSIVPVTESTDVLVTKEWKIPPDLIPIGSTSKEWLIANGVVFNGAAEATHVQKSSRLIVRNTQDQLDLVDSILNNAGGPSSPLQSPAFAASITSGLSDNLAYDPKARIQTGPGVPQWKWREVSFGWNGPVTAAQKVHPILISLCLERFLTGLRVALLLALLARLFGVRRWSGTIFRRSARAAALLALFCLGANASAQSPIPDSTTLDKLRTRLLETSDAYPKAADIPSVSFKLTDRKIAIDAEIHAAVRTAVPLPGRLPTWSPLTVLIDDKPEVALRRDGGYLWVVVEAGVHRVHVEGSLANVTDWQWTFSLKPHQVKIDAPDWTVTGVRPGGIPEAQVFFVRKQKAEAAAATYDRQEVQAIAQVARNLEIGLVWQVRTTVTRLSPLGKAVALRVPLLPGESVLSSNPIVKDGFIEVRLGAQEQAFSWEGHLAVVPSLALATQPDDTWVESWRLSVSPVWNVTLGGLPPVFEQSSNDLAPTWQPWPGESITLAISRPEAISGATVTVDRVTHEISLGARQRTSKLDLAVRSSLGEDFPVSLPAEAEITNLAHDGSTIPVRRDGGKLIIPLHPGEQTISLAWKSNVALGLATQTGEVRLPVESANIDTNINVPENRWVLWAHGPRRGPAVRFWGILIVSLLVAFALGRVALSPISILEWMLLAIGLTQVPLPAALAVVCWLFLLAWRRTDSYQRRGNITFNLLQIVLIAFTVGAVGILISAVGEGLLGNPEMFITGNDSSRTTLRWFQARGENVLPRPGCISISIWWYRFLMLVWALWLAAALLRWLRQGWQAFSTGGCFRSKPKKASTPPSPPPLPTQPPQTT